MDNQETIQHSIFDELDQKTIAPQHFARAVAAGIVAAALALVYHLTSGGLRSLVYLLQICVALYLLSCMRAYLRNFRAERARIWLLWLMRFTAALVVLTLLRSLYGAMIRQNIISYDNTFFSLLQPILMGGVLLGGIIAQAGFGILLQRIENDFIGLLRPLGIMYAYVIPAAMLTLVAGTYWGTRFFAISHFFFWMYFVGGMVESIPAVLMAVIFYRAMKYSERNL